MPRCHLPVLCAFLFTACVWGQETAGVRHRLDAMFRGTPPPRVEWNGTVVETAALTRRSEEANAEPGLHNQELLIHAALTDELQRKKQMPSDADLAAAYEEYRKEYDATPFTVAVIATKFKGYPSLEAFKQRWRLQHAFAATLPIDRKVLQEEADLRREFLVDTQVTVELWCYGARDEQAGVWNFEKAEARASQGLAALRAGKDADSVRHESDDFAGEPGPARLLSYNILRQAMGESEYTDLILGSAADTVFSAAKPGEVTGPLRGPKGYWLARVGRREGSPRRYEVKDERSEKLVRQLYVERRFREWTSAVLAKSVLRVPAK